MIAALFVSPAGPYLKLKGVECWGVIDDARNYPGPFPVVAHPPCERWGRYWSGGPSAKKRRLLGDDKGCFATALWAVRTFGGVLEHPEASHAWKYFGIRRPEPGGWIPADSFGGQTCVVDQGHYGHRARKRTWLYAKSKTLPELNWGPAKGERLDEGFHSKQERDAARRAGKKPVKRLSKVENEITPHPFAKVLINIALGAKS